MATIDQQGYIKGLIERKFVDFKSFKKWLATTEIVRTNGQIFSKSINLFELGNRITNEQASAIIDLIQPLDDVTYSNQYDQETIDKVQKQIDSITKEVKSWTFNAK